MKVSCQGIGLFIEYKINEKIDSLNFIYLLSMDILKLKKL